MNPIRPLPHELRHAANDSFIEPETDFRDLDVVPAAARSSEGWWPWLRRSVSVVFFVVVVWLLTQYAGRVDWADVLASLQALPVPALATAVALAAASHLLYSCFDLLGRHYTRHPLGTGTVMTVNFISYATNLCLGSVVGAIGFRLRLYSRLGLKPGVITRVVSMSMLTNWLGYTLLAGLLFLLRPLPLPPSWGLGNHGLQALGVVLVAIPAAYLVACSRAGDRVWTVRGHELVLPPPRMGLLQLAMSSANWCLMASIVWVLLRQQIVYTDVLTVLLVGAIAGVVFHVPAGLGVFEAVFIALLGHRVPEGRLLAALLGYRGVYYIGPLLIALVLYLRLEWQARQSNARGPTRVKRPAGAARG